MSKPQEAEFPSGIIDSWTDYTPHDLRVIAAEMERDGIKSVSVHATEEYGNATLKCEAKRMETEAEAALREISEERRRKQQDDWDRTNYERLRKKYGQN